MIEVLVALALLAIAVLGFSMLQLRALDAMQEASDRTLAMTLARDLAERIRVNRTQLTEYKEKINSGLAGISKSCNVPDSTGSSRTTTPMCSRSETAAYDASQMIQAVNNAGMKMIIGDCHGGDRQCIYIAWGDTTITQNNVSMCMVAGVYVAGAKCLVMEAYGT